MDVPDNQLMGVGSRDEVRCRMHAEILYTRYIEFLGVFTEIREYEDLVGWAKARLWNPVAGKANHAIVEWSYADMGSFDREYRARTHDPKYRALIRRVAAITVQGSGLTELLRESASQIPGPLKAPAS